MTRSSEADRRWNEKRQAKARLEPQWKEFWRECVEELERRMAKGYRTYKDRSFDRPIYALLAETEEEILDQINWSFMAWTRVRSLRGRIQALEDRVDEAEMDTTFAEFERTAETGVVDG